MAGFVAIAVISVIIIFWGLLLGGASWLATGIKEPSLDLLLGGLGGALLVPVIGIIGWILHSLLV